MKSNSDDSDYEDENVNNESARKGMEGFFSKQTHSRSRYSNRNNAGPANLEDEKHSSDSDDSDYNGEYFKSFNQSDSKLNVRPCNMYHDLSGEQDSNDDSSDQDVQCKKVSNTLPDIEDSGKTESVFPDTSDDDNEQQFDKPKGSAIIEDDAEFRSAANSNKDNSKNEAAQKRKRKDVSDDSTERSGKRLKIGNKIERMMGTMGYEPGRGLGKNKQGRLEPVEASTQHGRRGLGLPVPKLQAVEFEWNPDEEVVNVIEDMKWINSTEKCPPTLEEMKSWLDLGPKTETIDDETNFCDSTILSHVLASKQIFDDLDKVEMRRARTRSNPFETIRGAFFLNRAAVKMANIDRACNFMFTNTKHLKSNELLYFADVCAGPGGFSEYIMFRKGWHAKGFGFTLKNQNDFKLSEFYAGPCETFHPYYGPKDDGDVFDPSNQEGFKDIIMKHTRGKGVHFMMADGGFSVEGQENIQEILSKQLYLCQCLVALMIVRTRGHFVTKLFDLFTPFSAGLVYIMYRCFERVCIFKPNSSRPANAERYLICQGKRPHLDDVIKHLKYVNQLLLNKDDNNDVRQLVSFEELEKETQFVHYLKASNEELGRRQIVGLNKIAAFCKDANLIEHRQADMRKQCLLYWNVPDESRKVPRNMLPKDKVQALLKNSEISLAREPMKLTKDNINKTILNQPLDWFYMPCGDGPFKEVATFYLGMGRTKVYRYVNGTWTLLDKELKLDLPPDTLVYAQLVFEIKKECRQQLKIVTLHIFDAFMLGTDDISKEYIEKRHKLIVKFCEALWKPSDKGFSGYVPVRAKDTYPLDRKICEQLRVKQRAMKNNLLAQTYDLLKTSLDDDQDVSYLALTSILFLKSIVHPWTRHFSRNKGLNYVFNSCTGETLFEERRPVKSQATFIDSFNTSIVWCWPHDEAISMESFVQLVKDKIPKPQQLQL